MFESNLHVTGATAAPFGPASTATVPVASWIAAPMAADPVAVPEPEDGTPRWLRAIARLETARIEEREERRVWARELRDHAASEFQARALPRHSLDFREYFSAMERGLERSAALHLRLNEDARRMSERTARTTIQVAMAIGLMQRVPESLNRLFYQS